ncbi:D-alanyl-D-alanine carboxypeptidase family protein [Bacillus sp. 31A1R]|uniref:serine-type D-Ala-D-Ala carboxypeptidase n=1 Tax=Robertmurraya mangrovi TaxID=3098077 RepID=A0ABU5J5J1_9BACI|nr:D-alanyl-D-alanine carboxypeptidase family protein [Bacillus sp. 31A1R]MDZ5474663.1 D-alanyl-D-alanine carboxypeptidase family protein [Bacillus sp. 31A1R]
MHQFKKISLTLTVLFLCIATIFSGNVQQVEAAKDPLGLKAEAAILLDAKTGKILYAKNPDVILGVASMAKMMTEYLVLEAIANNKITWDQKVKINEYVHKLSAAPGLSNVGLTQGEEYTVEELYQAMAIHSGNAASVALAEIISGTEKNFVALMNKKAEELNLEDYKFVNSTGLNNSSLLGNHPAGNSDEENIMSARATAKLAYRLLTDYPEVLETASMPVLKFRDGREYKNFNWMLPTLIYQYEGVDGLKTGSTDFAGAGFTATAERNGQRFISVVMKAADKDERFSETRKILDYAFSNFGEEEIVKENYQVKKQKTLPVTKGKEDQVEIHTKEAINMVIKNGEKDNYKTVLVLDKEKLNKKGELTAPVKKGDKVGYLTIEPKEGKELGFLTKEGQKQIKVDVIAANDVEKANWFVLMMRGIGGFFGDIWGSVSSAVKGMF